jgi:hypothetical protein
MKLLVGLGAILFLSCNNGETKKNTEDKVRIVNSRVDSFGIFLDKFAQKMFPISVDQKLLDSFPYNSADLDTLLVSRFIEKDSVIFGDLSTYSSTKYYPLYKFKFNNLPGVIVMYSSGSGAIDDEYHLIVYDSSGLVKSNLVVGKQIGSCESMESETFSINRDYLVSSKDDYYEGDCETEKLKLVSSKVLRFQIKNGGSVRRFK